MSTTAAKEALLQAMQETIDVYVERYTPTGDSKISLEERVCLIVDGVNTTLTKIGGVLLGYQAVVDRSFIQEPQSYEDWVKLITIVPKNSVN